MKNEKSCGSLPFSVDRKGGRPLIVQVADGLRQAIVCGRYRPGDVLPSSRVLENRLGVSRIVVKAAFAQLASEGFTTPRPRVGTIVRDRNEKQWRGRVVLVYENGDDNYLKTMLASSMQDHLTNEGYILSQASVLPRADGTFDFSRLDAALSRSVDLAVVMYHRPELYAYLDGRGVPFAVFGEARDRPRSAVGSVYFNYDLANADFAAACRAAGVKEIVEVYWNKLMCDIAPAMKRSGIRVRKVKVPVDESEGRLIGVRRAGRIAFEKMIGEGRVASFYFIADDYLAAGALAALTYAGLKAPEDLWLTTWANAGLGPDYHRALSRLELDPCKAGETVASAVIKYLKTGEFPSGVVVGPRWVPGETMGEAK